MRLNLDAGELPDEPEELWAQFDILNIACGGHAGDAASMTKVVAFCVAHDLAIGAHPSYPDRADFGRRSLAIDHEELARSLAEQCRALSAIAHAHGASVRYVKPHGALYHDAARDPALAALVVSAAVGALGTAIAIIGPRGHLATAAAARGLAFLVEGFADRRMRADGTLVPRGDPDALIVDPAAAAAQARSLAGVDTICIHADTPGALAIASAVRAAVPAWVALGDRAVRFARPAGVSPRALVAAIERWPGVTDVVVAKHDVAAYFARHVAPRLEPQIRALAQLPDTGEPVHEHALRATYDGADLDDVARATSLTTAEVIRLHADALYTVDSIGFAPGFAYLVGLDARLHLPRRATPRPRVPAGSLAIAGEHTAIYPFTSPGGWHLLGRVDAPLFGPGGALLQLGDRVRFVR